MSKLRIALLLLWPVLALIQAFYIVYGLINHHNVSDPTIVLIMAILTLKELSREPR